MVVSVGGDGGWGNGCRGKVRAYLESYDSTISKQTKDKKGCT